MKNTKIARILVDGVIGDEAQKYERVEILLQRVVDGGGDSVLLTMASGTGDRIAYIVPTKCLMQILDEPLEIEEE